jgi:hypothetical protein
MGAEAQTTLKIGRQAFVGTAHLETDSAEKLVIPRAAR